MGQLVFQATAGGQVALVGPNPSSNFSLNVPAVNGNLVTTGDTGTVTNTMLASSAYTAPGTIGSGTPNSGAFTTLSASSTVSGTGFSTYLASPPAIGGTTPSTGKFTSITNTGLTATQVIYATTGGLETSSANMTFNGTSLTLANDASISGLTVGKGGGSVSTNTSFGISSIAQAATGGNNTSVGYEAMFSNTSGSQNTAVGYIALENNTTGSGNAVLGSQALYQNTTGGSNVAIGQQSLQANTTASNNTAVGYQAAYTNSTGYSITALGNAALYSNTTGYQNVAVGAIALYLNTTGINNSAVGYAALYNNTTGSYNTAQGFQALVSNTTASNNTAVGYQAGYSNTTGGSSTFLGYQAGYGNTTGDITAIGSYAGVANTTGTSNTFLGQATGNSTTTGSYNLFAGGGDSGTYGAGQLNTTGAYNTGLGVGALKSNTTASNNTAVGYQAGYSATGTSNTFIGYQTGQGATPITSGTYNVHLGFYTSGSSASVSNEIVISSGSSGGNGKGASTGYINANGGGTYQGNNSTLWSITSDQRLKKNIVDNNDGLDKITQIKVRNFEYRTADEVTDLPKESVINIQGVQLGAIAQELIEVLPDCVKTESTGVMSVDASNITWHLINAVKELNAKVTALEAKLGA